MRSISFSCSSSYVADPVDASKVMTDRCLVNTVIQPMKSLCIVIAFGTMPKTMAFLSEQQPDHSFCFEKMSKF